MAQPPGEFGAARAMLAPVVAGSALGTAAQAAESIAVLDDSATTRLLQPADHGGSGVTVAEFVSAISELAARDGSAAWLAAVLNAAAHQVAALGRGAAARVWGPDPAALVTMDTRSDGRLTNQGSHFRLTGRWKTVTGATFAHWLLLRAYLDGTRHWVLLPRDAVEVAQRNDIVGLRTTGICDVTVAEVAVEESAVYPCADEKNCAEGEFDIAPTVVTGAAVAAAVIGAAAGTWQAHVGQVRQRLATSYGSEDTAERTTSAVVVAETASAIAAARLQLDESLRAGAVPAARAQLQAVARARTAADQLLSSGSRHALDAADPVTRLWLDVSAGYRLVVRLLDEAGAG
jgi:3-hydroxy-9,10-secoandrosta-1,3,5(10)-triene-9,17-dione monooxygenase